MQIVVIEFFLCAIPLTNVIFPSGYNQTIRIASQIMLQIDLPRMESMSPQLDTPPVTEMTEVVFKSMPFKPDTATMPHSFNKETGFAFEDAPRISNDCNYENKSNYGCKYITKVSHKNPINSTTSYSTICFRVARPIAMHAKYIRPNYTARCLSIASSEKSALDIAKKLFMSAAREPINLLVFHHFENSCSTCARWRLSASTSECKARVQ